MGQGTVRLLKAGEIECRIAAINEKGLSLLLYKDARVDQRILDETFGVFGWKRSHQCIDGNLYCTVEVFNRETGEWVAKQDVGTTGYTEKEKSQASDSFKRACFNWGIGRELYTAPFIWLPAAKVGIQRKGDKYVSNERFAVKSISYNENREIISLEIADSKGHVVYCLQEEGRPVTAQTTESGNPGSVQTAGNSSSGTVQKPDKPGKASGQEGMSARRPGQKDERGAQGGIRRDISGQETVQPGGQAVDSMAGHGERQGTAGRTAADVKGGISSTQEIVLMAELNRTGVKLDEVLGRYQLKDISQMTQETYNRALAALRQTKPKGTAA